MTFNSEISVGDIVALFALIGSFVMLILTFNNQKKTKEFAQKANAYNDSAKKYYDLMVEQLEDKAEHYSVVNKPKSATGKAYCDANIVKIGSNKWILKVFNKGDANAKDVYFKYLIDGAPAIISPGETTFPIQLLEPQKNVDYHIMIHLGLRSASWEYEISWTNQDGSTDSKKGVLTLPLS
jgi:hypothetical protein